MVKFAFSDMKYVFNVRPRLLYVIFRFCKFTVPVLRFGVTNNPFNIFLYCLYCWSILLKSGVALE